MKIQLKLTIMFLILLTLASCSSSTAQKNAEMNKKAEIYYSHGTEALLKKEYTTALEALIKAKELDPKNSKIINNLGMAYFFKGRTDLAVKELTLAIQIDEKNSDAKNNLASIYYNQKKYGEAKNLWSDVKDDLIYHHQYRTYYNLALISETEGNEFEAMELLRKSVAVREDYCPAHFKLGELSSKKQRFKDALKHYKDASMGDCYNFPAPLYEQGRMMIKLKDYDNAREKFSEVIQRFKSTPYEKMARVQIEQLSAATQTSSRSNDRVQIKESAPVRKKIDQAALEDADLEQELEKYEAMEF